MSDPDLWVQIRNRLLDDTGCDDRGWALDEACKLLAEFAVVLQRLEAKGIITISEKDKE